MATLRFDGSDDWLRGTGQGAMNGALSIATLYRRTMDKSHALVYFHNAGGGVLHGLHIENVPPSTLYSNNGGFTPASGLALNLTDWYICVLTRTAGTVQSRLHLKNITTDAAWQHANATASQSNPATAVGGTIRLGYQYAARGDMALAAFWDGTTLSDGQVEQLATNKKTSDWHALAPASLTELTSLAPTDLEGLVTWTLPGGAANPALTGTDPTGWTFDSTGGDGGDGAGEASGGFLRDDTGALVLSAGPGTWHEGFLRDEDGALVTAAVAGGETWQSGFLRNSAGALATTATGTQWQGGFYRNAAGALAVGATAPLTWQAGFLRDTAGRLVTA